MLRRQRPAALRDNWSWPHNYTASGQGIFNADQWDVRGDFQVTQKIHAFGRFSRFTDTLDRQTDLRGGRWHRVSALAATAAPPVGANDSVAAGADMAINATLLTDFRLGYYRYNIVTSKYDQDATLQHQLGIPGSNLDSAISPAARRRSTLRIQAAPASPSSNQGSGVGPQYGSGLNINRCNCPLSQREDQYQIVNNWTKILGNHSVKFGADLRYARNLRVPSDVNRAGNFNFGVGPTSESRQCRAVAWALRPSCWVMSPIPAVTPALQRTRRNSRRGSSSTGRTPGA